MKILTGAQIAAADRYTIENEPIESIDLMERASEVIAQWICNHIPQGTPLCFFVGKGNNGGDALAVARMLHNVEYPCTAVMAYDKKELGEACRCNLDRLPRGVRVFGAGEVPIPEGSVLVDGLLGTGVKGEVTGPVAGLIDLINGSGLPVVSIDMPSGMLTEFGNAGRKIVRATATLTLEFPKLSLLLPEAGEYAGTVEVLPMELDARFIAAAETPYHYATREWVDSLWLPRPKFGHKGNFGHALLVCGSEGMAGAAVLAAGAALRSGCALVTVHLPREECGVIHATFPSAMVSPDPETVFSRLPSDMEKYNAVGAGSGLGQHPLTVSALERLLSSARRLVLDADALNILAAHPSLQELVPAGSVLTPHPGELRRLTGDWQDDRERMEKAVELASRLQSVVVVKGAHTMICSAGRVVFNSTGNPGMAKGGSGDVLTGYIAGLLARGYDPETAALLGVYIHGEAGDKAAAYFGQEGMNAADLIDFLAECQAGHSACGEAEGNNRV